MGMLVDFSAWDWINYFRLHDAACLIAGVMPVSKDIPTDEDLPPQARPILLALRVAYVEWKLQERDPERPKRVSLKGDLNNDGTRSKRSVPMTGSIVIVSRAAIRDFISEMGHKSAYDFSSIEQKKLFTPVKAETVGAGAGEVPSNGKKWTPERLAELKAYRDKHGTSDAAKQYGISPARIRVLLPGDKPRPEGYSAFTHHSK